MTQFAIAGIQMCVTIHNNLEEMKKRLALLMHLYPWVDMVMFSELAAHGPVHQSAQPEGGEFEKAFCELARRHRIWLQPGSWFEKRDGRIYNMAPVINPDGEIVARYRKMFPFTPYEQGVAPGTEFCVFDVPGKGRMGLAICYDLWFPELTRTLTSMGAEVILNPVLAHFLDRPADLAIAQATGAMFQTYVFHVNGLVAGGNGKSVVVDPSGRLLYEASVGEELIPVEVDFALVRRQRERGLLNMGQPLKSFRDRPVGFPVYQQGFDTGYLDGLGPLVKPDRAGGTPAPEHTAAMDSANTALLRVGEA